MAVELRCPDCRTKLRLPSDPGPGTEVECPKCGTVFSAPDPDTGEVPDPRSKSLSGDSDDEDRPGPAKKKRRPVVDDDDEDRPPQKKPVTSGGKSPDAKTAASNKKQPKRRKTRKKETNKPVMYALITGGVVFLITVILLMVWYLNRKPASYEMMTYLPEDCNAAGGFNMGHVQKYPAFFEKLKPTYQNLGFKKAAEALATALGTDMDQLVDYVVEGFRGHSPGAIVIRTKKEFDTSALAKLPGARPYTTAGQSCYAVSRIEGLAYDDLRVFAPTKRLIVFCPGNIPDGVFQKMVGGNKENKENTLMGRVGSLGTRTTRGTYWYLGILDETNRPAKEKSDDPNARKSEFRDQMATTAATIKGIGFKASVGSTAVRFEVILWCRDSDAAADMYQKFKDSTLSKGDDDEPPKWWKDFTQSTISNKKVALELLATIGAKSSGDLFIYSARCNTVLFMEVINMLAGRLITPRQ